MLIWSYECVRHCYIILFAIRYLESGILRCFVWKRKKSIMFRVRMPSPPDLLLLMIFFFSNPLSFVSTVLFICSYTIFITKDMFFIYITMLIRPTKLNVESTPLWRNAVKRIRWTFVSEWLPLPCCHFEKKISSFYYLMAVIECMC